MNTAENKEESEQKRVFSFSLKPSFHANMKYHAALHRMTLSKFFEHVVGNFIKERDEISKVYRDAIRDQEHKSYQEDSKNSIRVSKDTLKMLKGYRAAGTAENAAHQFIWAGLKAVTGSAIPEDQISRGRQKELLKPKRQAAVSAPQQPEDESSYLFT